jgi:hypothetical protein
VILTYHKVYFISSNFDRPKKLCSPPLLKLFDFRQRFVAYQDDIMPGIYAKQGSTSRTVYVEMNERTKPKELKESLKDAFRERLGRVKVSKIVFENSTKKKELGAEFIQKYSTKENPLLVAVDGTMQPNEVSDGLFRVSELDADLSTSLVINNILYERPCYKELTDNILSHMESRLKVSLEGMARSVFLTGTPGIGKTAFLCYFITKLREQRWKVLFGSRSMGNKFLFWDKDGKEFRLKKETVEDEYLECRDIFFVWDSIEMPTAFGPRVLCSSPRDNIGNQFKKTARILYMPTWSWEEIDAVYERIYSKLNGLLSRNVIAARFFVLGGVPRLLFDNLNTLACKLIDIAIVNTDQENLKQVASSDGAKAADSVSHRLIHRIIDASVDQDDFTECRIAFPSSYVSFEIMKQYSKNRRENALNFLEETSHVGIFGSLRGSIFEPFAHLYIQNGFEARARLLNADGTSQEVSISIPRREKSVVFGNYSEIAGDLELRSNEEKYFQPVSKTFECIDSWVVKDKETWAFQMTVGYTHKISTALYWYYKNLNVKHYVTVVYDKHKYDDFKYTKITKSKRKPFIDEEPPVDGCNIQQYVLLANISPETITKTDPWVGYEAFVPEPDDECVKKELGIS